MVRFNYAFNQTDVQPIVLSNVTSSTGSAIVAATYTMFNHDTQVQIGSSNIPMTVSGTTINTPNITWATLGDFLLQVRVTFADGIVDNTITIFVQVSAIPV